MIIEDMYRRNYHIVRGYILSICGDKHLAEDIASETFLKAIRHHKSYDGTCRPSTWLCTIARNLLYDEFRRSKRLVSLEQQENSFPYPVGYPSRSFLVPWISMVQRSFSYRRTANLAKRCHHNHGLQLRFCPLWTLSKVRWLYPDRQRLL